MKKYRYIEIIWELGGPPWSLAFHPFSWHKPNRGLNYWECGPFTGELL